MHHFTYRGGVLHAEDIALDRIAGAVGTPFYCYSTATLARHFKVFAAAFADMRALVCYAMKANSNQAVLRVLARLGAGADVVSGGELRRALAAGIPAHKITFSGVGKTAQELAAAVDADILCVNVESEPELELLSAVAQAKGRSANVALRVNPDIDARTHAKIATGKSENKFGIPISGAREVYAAAARLPGVRITGVDMHIGSQITELKPFDDAFALLADFVGALRHDGHSIEHIDVGGGLGVPYRDDIDPPPDPAAYAAVVKQATRALDCLVIFEPGRLLVGNAGILVTRVLYVKRNRVTAPAPTGQEAWAYKASHHDSGFRDSGGHPVIEERDGGDPDAKDAFRRAGGKTFVIVDAAMNDLIRPTLYEAHHDIRPVHEAAPGTPRIIADVVGPVCESGDFLAREHDLAEPCPGDLLAIMTAGAYGAVQAGTYNTRPLVPEVLVKGARFAVVRPRIEVDELIARDRVPAWIDE
jgi:diaminopimelate decarboxylase